MLAPARPARGRARRTRRPTGSAHPAGSTRRGQPPPAPPDAPSGRGHPRSASRPQVTGAPRHRRPSAGRRAVALRLGRPTRSWAASASLNRRNCSATLQLGGGRGGRGAGGARGAVAGEGARGRGRGYPEDSSILAAPRIRAPTSRAQVGDAPARPRAGLNHVRSPTSAIPNPIRLHSPATRRATASEVRRGASRAGTAPRHAQLPHRPTRRPGPRPGGLPEELGVHGHGPEPGAAQHVERHVTVAAVRHGEHSAGARRRVHDRRQP